MGRIITPSSARKKKQAAVDPSGIFAPIHEAIEAVCHKLESAGLIDKRESRKYLRRAEGKENHYAKRFGVGVFKDPERTSFLRFVWVTSNPKKVVKQDVDLFDFMGSDSKKDEALQILIVRLRAALRNYDNGRRRAS